MSRRGEQDMKKKKKKLRDSASFKQGGLRGCTSRLIGDAQNYTGYAADIRGDISGLSREITHMYYDDVRKVVQLVSPARLKEILDADGSNYDRPVWLREEDEWVVGEEAEEENKT